MNGVHDMGGMTCFGPIVREENEPVFHADWEKRVFAMGLVGGVWANFDEAWRALEQMDPVHYLASSYYEHWLHSLESIAIEKGLLTPQELAIGVGQTPKGRTKEALSPEQAKEMVRQGMAFQRGSDRQTPQFKMGDQVRARNLHPSGHTRLPRYARGKRGVISQVHGTFVYPDTVAHGLGEQPQPLYSVRFEARELWGPMALARDSLSLDLWEDYLELTDQEAV